MILFIVILHLAVDSTLYIY